MITVEDYIRKGIKVAGSPPEGWKRLEHTNTEPRGYKWYSNGESRFGGHYKHALVKEG